LYFIFKYKYFVVELGDKNNSRKPFECWPQFYSQYCYILFKYQSAILDCALLRIKQMIFFDLHFFDIFWCVTDSIYIDFPCWAVFLLGSILLQSFLNVSKNAHCLEKWPIKLDTLSRILTFDITLYRCDCIS